MLKFQFSTEYHKRWFKVKVTRFKVKVKVKVVGQVHKCIISIFKLHFQSSESQGSRSVAVDQGHRVKVKVVGGNSLPHCLVGGVTRRHFYSLYKQRTCS